MDRLEAMSMLVTVAQAGSLSSASRSMKVPLATLSRKISDLETWLGARLLLRTTRRLSLTAAGTAYVAAARRILEQVEEAERDAVGEYIAPKGELVVTAPLMFGRLHVVPLMAEFLAMFPGISIRLLLADRNVNLVDDQVDVAVRIGQLPDSSLVATKIGTMRRVTCASPSVLTRHGVPDDPASLLRFPCVAVDGPVPFPSWRYRMSPSRLSVDIDIVPRLIVTTHDAAAAAALRGAGVTQLLHYQVAEELLRGDLRLILEAFEPEPLPVHLVHLSRLHMPVKVRCFLDHSVPRLTTILAGLDGAGGV